MVGVRVLNVAEKPSVAKTVSHLLSQNNLRVREGRSRFNKIFEFGYAIGNQHCLMSMTSVSGHLMELEFEERYRKWNSCDPTALYEAPVQKYVPQDKLALQRTLEEESRQCQWLVLWLDCDREGENIAFEVVDVCLSANPRLNIWRARFSALTQRDVQQAVQNLGRPNRLYADAVDARQEIDLRIGASFTRFQTQLLGETFNLLAGEERRPVLSYGPCQFPTLGFVVERYWEVQAHVPEDFWKITCVFDDGTDSACFTWMRGHLFDYLAAAVVHEMCIENPTATVFEVRGQECKKYHPHPLNTVELQKRASRYFRMGAEETMKVAEELYQAGFISYPRTETDFFSPNIDLMGIIRGQTEHPSWGPYANRLLDPQSSLFRHPSNGGHDDQAHPPIHPTKFSAGERSWGNHHKQIYELVTRHFLACVSQPAIGYRTTAHIDIAGEKFHATGLMITARNYLEVYRFDSWGETTIPNFQEGQQFIPSRLTLDKGSTTAPQLLSEADLITMMDKAGIGTDATMHDHIKKLLDRKYATKDANTRFSPTNLGEALVMGYDDMGYELWKPYLRAMMEQDMKAVSLGTKSKGQVLETCLHQMKNCFLDAISQKQKLIDAMGRFFERTQIGVDQQRPVGEIVRLCPICKESNMTLRKKPDGKFMVGCLGFPRCRNAVWLPGAIMEASVATTPCNSCSPGVVLKVKFKFRRAEIPAQYETVYTGCVGGCDEFLNNLFEICGTSSRAPAPGSEVRPVDGSNGNGNDNRRACSLCGGQGHNRAACPQSRGSGTSRSRGGHQEVGRTRNSSGTEAPLCGCQEPCVLLTANTENNPGRKFYRCRSRGCEFFLWEDAANSQQVQAPTSVNRQPPQPNHWRHRTA